MLILRRRAVFFCAMFLACSFVFANSGFAQTEQIEQADAPIRSSEVVDDISIPFGWKKSDYREYSVTTKKLSTKGKLTEVEKEISLTIVDESDDAVVVELRTISKVDAKALKDVEEIEGGIELAAMGEDLVIEVAIGRDGIVREILNWNDVEKVVAHVEGVLRNIVDEMKLSKEKLQAVEKILELQKSRPVIESNMLEPLNQLVMMTGISLSSTTPYKGETTTSMMMTNDVPASETYTVKSVDEKTGIVNVSWTQVVEGEPAASIVKTGFEAFARRMGVKESKMTPLHLDGRLAFSSSDTWIDITDGWPEKIVWHSESKNITNGKDGATSDITIERIHNDRPKQ